MPRHGWVVLRDTIPINSRNASAGIMRVLNVGRAALNRALERGELRSLPHVLTVSLGESKPMGRPLDVPELRRIYAHAIPHVQAFMVWR